MNNAQIEKNNGVLCTLCPRKCLADRKNGETGYCGCGDEIRVARIAPHKWEEPCICGENGSGTVFFVGCNLGCVFCQNREISRNGNAGRVYTESGLADEYIRLQSLGVSNINFVTPTPWSDKIRSSLDMAWERGLYIPTVYNCGGYESREEIAKNAGYISVYLTDFKYMDGGLAGRYSSAPDYPEAAKAALDEMMKQRGSLVFDGDGMLKKGVIVRVLVLPGCTDDTVKILDYLRSSYGDDIIVSLMSQYTPFDFCPDELRRKITEEEYKRVTDHADSIGISNLYTQSGEAASESFVPLWDK